MKLRALGFPTRYKTEKDVESSVPYRWREKRDNLPNQPKLARKRDDGILEGRNGRGRARK